MKSSAPRAPLCLYSEPTTVPSGSGNSAGNWDDRSLYRTVSTHFGTVPPTFSSPPPPPQPPSASTSRRMGAATRTAPILSINYRTFPPCTVTDLLPVLFPSFDSETVLPGSAVAAIVCEPFFPCVSHVTEARPVPPATIPPIV